MYSIVLYTYEAKNILYPLSFYAKFSLFNSFYSGKKILQVNLPNLLCWGNPSPPSKLGKANLEHQLVVVPSDVDLNINDVVKDDMSVTETLTDCF